MKKMSIILLIVMGVAFSVQAKKVGHKKKISDPLQILKEKYQEFREVIKKYGKDEHKMRQKLREVMDTFVDFRELSKRTLPGTWDKLKPEEKKEFVAEFKKMIQRSYLKKFHADQKFTIEYNTKTKFNKKDRTAYVSTTIKAGKSEAKVDYSFYKNKGKWWAYDVIIDDISMMKKYRRQFVRIIRKSGFEVLLNKIKRRNKIREEEEKEEEAQKVENKSNSEDNEGDSKQDKSDK